MQHHANAAGGATICDNGCHRYRLWRHIDPSTLRNDEGTVVFVMLNPSTADHAFDDPTIRRCTAYAARWGYTTLEVVNLWSYRATHAKELWAEPTVDLNGPGQEHEFEWSTAMMHASLVVVAWGAHRPTVMRRHPYPSEPIGQLLRVHTPEDIDLVHLGLTKKDHEPRHPLMLRNDVDRQPYAA